MTKYFLIGVVLVFGAYQAGLLPEMPRLELPHVPLPSLPLSGGQDGGTPPLDKAQECRDACEQKQVVEALGDAEMRACRARCGDAGPASRPYQPIRRITRAKAERR